MYAHTHRRAPAALCCDAVLPSPPPPPAAAAVRARARAVVAALANGLAAMSEQRATLVNETTTVKHGLLDALLQSLVQRALQLIGVQHQQL